MSTGNSIEHKGIIDEISDDMIRVKFTSFSACADCHAKGICSASDMKEKEIMVKRTDDSFSRGEKVSIILKGSMGFKAVLFGYLYPFFIVLSVLVILTHLGINELRAGLISVGILIPYYLGVYFFRKKIDRKFNFIIRKTT